MCYRARNKPAPLFPFGFGKSYTDFKLDGLAIGPIAGVSATDLKTPMTVTNVGPVAGCEVVQIYVYGVLKGFNKVSLAPGESCIVEVALDKYAFSEWSPKEGSWVVEPRA